MLILNYPGGGLFNRTKTKKFIFPNNDSIEEFAYYIQQVKNKRNNTNLN